MQAALQHALIRWRFVVHKNFMLIVFSCYKLRWNKPAFDNSWCSHRGHSFVIACVHDSLSYVKVEIPYIKSEKTKEKRKAHTQQRESQSQWIYVLKFIRSYIWDCILRIMLKGWFRTNLWCNWKRILPMSYLCRWGTMSQLYDCISLLPCHFSFQPKSFSVPWDVGIQRLQWKGGTEEWKKILERYYFKRYGILNHLSTTCRDKCNRESIEM